MTYYNDSKATNPDSTLRAARSFEPGTVVLILGGRDKGADWATLARSLAGAVRHVALAVDSGVASIGVDDRHGIIVAVVRLLEEGDRNHHAELAGELGHGPQGAALLYAAGQGEPGPVFLFREVGVFEQLG